MSNFFCLGLSGPGISPGEINIYANCVYFVIVATEFFTNWNAIEGLGRGYFRTVSHKVPSTSLNVQINNMNPIKDLVRIHCIVF